MEFDVDETKELIESIKIALLIFISFFTLIGIPIAISNYNNPGYNRDQEFKQVCKAIAGQLVWNRNKWECLK